MDENKAAKLREIGYEMYAGNCGSCKHFRAADDRQAFGTCALYSYEHQKHSDSTRQLSVSRNGGCPSWEVSDDIEVVYGGFQF